MAARTALEIVCAWEEGTEVNRLRAENAYLKAQLELWQGDTTEPVKGKYYFAPKELLEMHGWRFLAEEPALRCEGPRWRQFRRLLDGTKVDVYEHVFLAPYEYDDDDYFGRTGWIEFGFQNTDLHQICEVEWDELCHPTRYLNSDDEICLACS